MRQHRLPQETAALAAARGKTLLFVGLSILLAVVMQVLSVEFIAMHCIVLAAITLAAAVTCAWAVIPILPQAARRAGMQGGMTSALAYVLPFLVVTAYRFATLDSASAGRMAAEMSAAQATNLTQQGIPPGVEYFRGQFISYMAGYLLFGLLFGMALGALGGIIAQRTAKRSE